MDFTTKISAERVSDLIVTGLECGSMATFGVVDGNAYMAAYKAADSGADSENYAEVEIFDRHDESTPNELLTDAFLKNGMKDFAEKCPRHFADFMKENEDAITGMAFLECCVFGEVIYG